VAAADFALESRVQTFKETLEQEQLRPETIRQYLDQARLFLAYLERQQLLLECATPQDLDGFIAERLRIYRRQYGHLPRRLVRWRCEYTKAIHRLLRGAQQQWPPPSSGDPTFSGFNSPDRARIGSELHPGLSMPCSPVC
jgi:hypothetical protein